MRDAVSSRLWDVVRDILLCGAVLPTVLRTFWFLRNMTTLDFSVEELNRLFDLAGRIEADPAKYAHACEGKKLRQTSN